MALNRNSSFYTCIYFINYGTSDEIHHPGERIIEARSVLCLSCMHELECRGHLQSGSPCFSYGIDVR